MKVAIVGAGLSGLSCAFELKKHGIRPTIFEKNSLVGDSLEHSVLLLRIFTKFNYDPKKYFKNNYGLNIASLKRLNKAIMIGPSNKTIVRGSLGYIYKKGIEPYSIENQIARQVNLPIIFDTYIKFDDIKDDFDFIVWAAGDHRLTKKLNIWTSTFNTYVRIATVIGNFELGSSTMWLNHEYTRNGYSYILPHSNSKASLVLIINNISPNELDHYWKTFLTKENIQYKVLETRDLEYTTGFVNPIKLNNIYFVGNAGGLTENCIGAGVINAIESGILAAKSIAKKLDYNELMKDTLDAIKINYELRKFLNTFDNKGFDNLLAFLNLPIIKQIIYNNPLYKATISAHIIKLYNKFIKI